MSTGVLEYALESALLPNLKQLHAVSYAGLAMLVIGEAIRKTAMVCFMVLPGPHNASLTALDCFSRIVC